MPDLSVYKNLKTKGDFERQLEMDRLDRQVKQAQLMSAQMGAEGPASVQEWKYFQRMTPQDQAAYLEMKRAPQIMNLGGSQAVRSPFGGIGESYDVTPKVEDMPSFQAEVEGARKRAASLADAESEAKKGATKANKMISVADEAKQLLPVASGGYGGALASGVKGALNISDQTTQANARLKQLSGWLVSNVPRMEGPQSNFDVKNYERMAGDVGNILLPIGDRIAALNGLISLQEKYSGLNKDGNGQESFMPPPLPNSNQYNDLGEMASPAMPPMAKSDIEETLFNARKALRNGAPADAVRARLIQAGIDPSKAGL